MTTLMNYFASPIVGEWGDEAEDCTDGVPVLRTTNFTADGRLSYDDLTFRAIDTEKKKDKILKPGDIIIEKSGGTPKKPVGRCVYFDRDDDYDYFCSNFTAVLRANPETVNTKYLWYILQEHYKTRQCLKYQYKTNGIANLDITDYLSHIEVDLPSRDVQDKRVEAMDYSQHLLDIHQELLDIVDKAVKSRFIEMFGHPIINERNWTVFALGDCLQTIESGKSFVCDSNSRTDDNPGLLKLSAATYGIYKPEENKAIRSEKEFVEQAEVHAGDLLFTRKNTPELVGMCAYVWQTPRKLMMPDLIFRLIPTDKVHPIFLWKLINHDMFRGKIQDLATGSAKSMSNISQERLRGLRIIVPPIDLQNQFADFVQLADKSKLTIQKSLENLTELRESLMQEYFE